MINKKKTYIFLFFLLGIFFGGCGFYSFTGASISPDVKTISIQQFPNLATIVQPTLSQRFTQALRDKFSSNTQLKLQSSDGDLNIEGEIIAYTNQPVAIQGNQQAALNRLTISIKVRFTNIKDEKQNFESQFSRYKDYNSMLNFASVENSLIDEINKEIVEDIFNKAVVNW